jgi:uncharacterized protein YnzC (UPF0291/DUF896 family)
MDSPSITANSEAAILARLIEPEKDDLAPEAAQSLLTIDFADVDVVRMNELAEKARQGTLRESETVELESYRHVGHLLALMQSKARSSLKRTGVAP